MDWSLALMPGFGAAGCVTAGLLEMYIRVAPDLRWIGVTDRPQRRAWLPYLVFETLLGIALTIPPLIWWPAQLSGWGPWVLPAAFILAPATARARAMTLKFDSHPVPIGPAFIYSWVRRRWRNRLRTWRKTANDNWVSHRALIADTDEWYPSGSNLLNTVRNQAEATGCLGSPQVDSALSAMQEIVDRPGKNRTKDVVFKEVLAQVPALARVPGIADKVDGLIYRAKQAPSETAANSTMLWWTKLAGIGAILALPIALAAIAVSAWDPAARARTEAKVEIVEPALEPTAGGSGRFEVEGTIRAVSAAGSVSRCGIEWRTRPPEDGTDKPLAGSAEPLAALDSRDESEQSVAVDLSRLQGSGTASLEVSGRCTRVEGDPVVTEPVVFLVDTRSWEVTQLGD